VGRRVVQDDKINLAKHLGLQGGAQAKSYLEAIGRRRIDRSIEQHTEIDIALAVGAAVSGTSKQVRRDDAWYTLERVTKHGAQTRVSHPS
jgi:hypothetical protein